MSEIANVFITIVLIVGNAAQIYCCVCYFKELKTQFYNYFHHEEALQIQVTEEQELLTFINEAIESL